MTTTAEKIVEVCKQDGFARAKSYAYHEPVNDIIGRDSKYELTFCFVDGSKVFFNKENAYTVVEIVSTCNLILSELGFYASCNTPFCRWISGPFRVQSEARFAARKHLVCDPIVP